MIRLGLLAIWAGGPTVPIIAEAAPFRTLYNFMGSANGYGAFAVAKDGTMYTTMRTGGTAGDGALLAFNPSSHAMTLLYSFQGGADDAQPVPGLVLTKSCMIYGATSAGGSANEGTVFAFDTRTAAEEVLSSFTGSNGQTPQYGPVPV